MNKSSQSTIDLQREIAIQHPTGFLGEKKIGVHPPPLRWYNQEAFQESFHCNPDGAPTDRLGKRPMTDPLELYGCGGKCMFCVQFL